MSLRSTATRRVCARTKKAPAPSWHASRSSKAEFSQTLAARQLELESLADRRSRTDAELQEKRQAIQQTRRDLDALNSETQSLRARRDSLDQILQHRAYANTSVKRLFAAIEHNQVQGLKPVGVLADFVELKDPRFERATEEFLHEELEYVVVRDWDEAQRGVDLLRAELDGRATFLVEPDFSNDGSVVHSAPVPEPPIGPETGIVGRLCDGIRFTNGLTNAPAELLPRLARCYFAESRSCAELLAFEYPDLFFLLDDGVCYHGHAVTGGNKTASGPLAMKRELRELSVLYEKKQREAAAARERLDSLEKASQLLAEELELVRTELQKQEKETLLLDQEMRKLAEESQPRRAEALRFPARARSPGPRFRPNARGARTQTGARRRKRRGALGPRERVGRRTLRTRAAPHRRGSARRGAFRAAGRARRTRGTLPRRRRRHGASRPAAPRSLQPPRQSRRLRSSVSAVVPHPPA